MSDKKSPAVQIREDMHRLLDRHIEHFTKQLYGQVDAYFERVESKLRSKRTEEPVKDKPEALQIKLPVKADCSPTEDAEDRNPELHQFFKTLS